VTPNRGMGPQWGDFCQITLTSCSFWPHSVVFIHCATDFQTGSMVTYFHLFLIACSRSGRFAAFVHQILHDIADAVI